MSPKDRIFLGMLTPSSNTTLEPVTARMLEDLPEVTAHFGRFRVTEISLAEQALGQFELEPMLAAAELLADARCHSICWNGTSAGWLGFERDRELCRAIEARTRIRACSSVLNAVGPPLAGTVTGVFSASKRPRFRAASHRCWLRAANASCSFL